MKNTKRRLKLCYN